MQQNRDVRPFSSTSAEMPSLTLPGDTRCSTSWSSGTPPRRRPARERPRLARPVRGRRIPARSGQPRSGTGLCRRPTPHGRWDSQRRSVGSRLTRSRHLAGQRLLQLAHQVISQEIAHGRTAIPSGPWPRPGWSSQRLAVARCAVAQKFGDARYGPRRQAAFVTGVDSVLTDRR